MTAAAMRAANRERMQALNPKWMKEPKVIAMYDYDDRYNAISDWENHGRMHDNHHVREGYFKAAWDAVAEGAGLDADFRKVPWVDALAALHQVYQAGGPMRERGIPEERFGQECFRRWLMNSPLDAELQEASRKWDAMAVARAEEIKAFLREAGVLS